MKSILISIILIALFLSGCNLPGQSSPATPTANMVATEVQKLLETMPSATSPATLAPVTSTPAPDQPTNTPTLAPSATPQPSPTVPPQPTPTTDPGDPAVSLGKPGWTDKLDNAKNFYTYDNENTEIKHHEGFLVLTSKTDIGWHGWTLTYAQSASDFYVQAVFKTEGCGGSDLYGLVFRADKENAGYFFGVTCDGQYNLYARDFNNNVNTKIRDLTPSSAIMTGSGQQNRLGVLASGDKISLYVNGLLLEEINDGTYAQGYFGPFVAGYTADFSVSLDEISLWKQN